MNYPKYVKVGDELFPINTNFKVAIECEEIGSDTTIGDFERGLAIIYKLYGDKGLENPNNYSRLLELGLKYLTCGKNNQKSDEKEEITMDFKQDYGLIKASFMSDYQIDIDKIDLHWWEFNDLINGLSNSELGYCCILNRIRNLRATNLSDIKDKKIREETRKAKEQWQLKKNEPELTEKELESIKNLDRIIGRS